MDDLDKMFRTSNTNAADTLERSNCNEAKSIAEFLSFTVKGYQETLQLVDELKRGHRREVSSCVLYEWQDDSLEKTLEQAEFIIKNYESFFTMMNNRYPTLWLDVHNFDEHLNTLLIK